MHQHTEPRTLKPAPSPLRVWYLAARPKTLGAAIAPVVIGTGLAYGDGGFHLGAAVAALLGALLIQVGTNLCNDYADFKKGADTKERIGPVRATQVGWVTPEAMLRATILVFALAALIGVYLVIRGGWPMFWIGALSIMAGVAYTVGPYALAYLGLGDLFVLVFFGPVAVGGAYYVQTLEWPLYVTVAGIAPGLLSCAILSVNNLRDVDQDRPAGKRTLAVRFGKVFARYEYLFCVIGGCVGVPLVLWWKFAFPPLIWVSALSMGAGCAPLRAVIKRFDGPALNPALGQTARMLLVYALLFTATSIFGRLLI